jgi:carboxylesterase type B
MKQLHYTKRIFRLNIFSAPNNPQSTGGIGNFALSDIEAAIKWVHENIAGFGGDPDRITISGQSAGAIAADAYAYSHPNDTIVKGVDWCENYVLKLI